MALIKGITIKLYEPIQIGVDAFYHPVFVDRPVDVENVLISPVDSQEVIDELELSGKKLVYELSIPKTDEHDWRDRTVEFYGAKWRTVGLPREWMQELVPLDWNKKVRVERYE